MYIVIMAGGSGTRFWPASRAHKPKQFLKLFGDKTFFQDTVERVLPLAGYEAIYTVTTKDLKDSITACCPNFNPRNIIIEPIGRNTAPCIGLASIYIRKSDPDAVIMVIPSDHYISEKDLFLTISNQACGYARRGQIVTLGIPPTRPETGFGYIQYGDPLVTAKGRADAIGARQIIQFVEKPNKELAIEFVRSGNYLWNSGMFYFTAETILNNIARFLPELYDGLLEIQRAIGTPREREIINQIFPAFPSISIDYGVMEKTKDIVVIPSPLGWSDMGTWESLMSCAIGEDRNFIYGEAELLDSRDNILYSTGPLIATIGIENMVVVATPEATLVCPREYAQDVKVLVEALKNKGKKEYL
jgi:mannose-1-phosphate guanylyltransferase